MHKDTNDVIETPTANPPHAQLFEEPWQAHAFALVHHLHAEGHFSWPQWADHLARELHRPAADPAGGEASGRPYYSCWLAALEALVTELGLLSREAYAERKAHLQTQPPNSRDHVARRTPIRIA